VEITDFNFITHSLSITQGVKSEINENYEMSDNENEDLETIYKINDN